MYILKAKGQATILDHLLKIYVHGPNKGPTHLGEGGGGQASLRITCKNFLAYYMQKKGGGEGVQKSCKIAYVSHYSRLIYGN